MIRHLLSLFVCSLFLLVGTISHGQERPTTPPKLVLFITVDQLRGDFPTRYLARFEEGGFRYLIENGTYYTNAHYKHACTETAVGHATLATGAYPSRHGIIGNDWVDPSTGTFVYNTEDERHHIIGQEPVAHQGVSPRNLLSSTIGDELVVSNAHQSRVFSVSGKDRGAILPGGRAGKAFWYSKSTGDFVTSTYYYTDYPQWVKEWNAAKPADQYKGKTWELLNDRSTYIAGEIDDRPYEVNFPPLGRTFPHSLGDNEHFYLILAFTPIGDTLTLDFTKTLIENENLGQGPATDLLAVSFSSTDSIGHFFGTSSLENEDNLLRLNRTLAELFDFVDKKVGLDHTLIILSSDHGGAEAPEYMETLGFETGRVNLDFFKKKGPLREALNQRYGRDDLIAAHNHPYLYLNANAMDTAGLNIEAVEQFIAAEVVKTPGIAFAQTRSDLLAGRVVESLLSRQIRRNFHPQRSGNVYIVQDQYWFLHSTDAAKKLGVESIGSVHGSPWTYDTYVPIFFAGHQVPKQTVDRRVAPSDIAPTIARYLGIKFPSGSTGNPLTEVLK